MFLLCMKNKYDVIYIREMEANPGPRLCSKLFHIPLYMEINDLVVPVLSEDGAPSALLRKVERNQKLDFLQSSGLVVPSVPMCDWIIDQFRLPGSKVHMIMNGTEFSKTDNLDQAEARNALGLPATCFCLGFVGNIYERYDFKSILEAMVECGNQIPDLRLVIVGEGPLTHEVKARANELGLENKTIFTGYVQPGELGKILPAIDIGLLFLTKEHALRYGPVTTKMSTYAVYKLPVITAGFSIEGYPDELAQGLFLVPPEDPRALVDMILWLYNHPKQRTEKAKILHDFVIRNLTWGSVTREILDVMRAAES